MHGAARGVRIRPPYAQERSFDCLRVMNRVSSTKVFARNMNANVEQPVVDMTVDHSIIQRARMRYFLTATLMAFFSFPWSGAEGATAIGSFNLKIAMAAIAASCLGAAVFAAPMTITPKAKIFSPAHRTSDAKPGYAPLGKGPAFQLGRAAPGEDEDCVRVTRMVGPDGRVYVTRGLICQ
jgi:hypothetical protein